MEGPAKRSVVYNGQTMVGTPVTLQTSVEPWAEYLASDGTVLRAKIVIVEATRIDGTYEADGTPLYVCKFQWVQHVAAPESLRRPPS